MSYHIHNGLQRFTLSYRPDEHNELVILTFLNNCFSVNAPKADDNGKKCDKLKTLIIQSKYIKDFLRTLSSYSYFTDFVEEMLLGSKYDKNNDHKQ